MKKKLFLIAGLCLYVVLLSTSLNAVHLEQVSKRWSNKLVVDELGFMGYALYDLSIYAKGLYSSRSLKYKDPEPYRLFLSGRAKARKTAARSKERNNKATGKNFKNIIYLQLESVDRVLLGLNYKGSEVMPFLSYLAKHSIFFENAFDQTGAGRSVDGEFLSLTSQIPIPNHSVYTGSDLSEIPSLPKVLSENGYRSFSMHGYIPSFWNRKNNHLKLGYDETFFIEDLDASDIIGWGISDSSIVSQAVDKMSRLQQPFYAHIILLSNHFPYAYVKKKMGASPTDIVEDYFSSVRYVDKSIELLFKKLIEKNMLKETIVAVYSDHDSGITKKIYLQTGQRYIDYRTHDKIPMMIYNGGPGLRVKRPSGLQDLAPTILDQLGIEQPQTFIGAPAFMESDVFLPGNLRITGLKDGIPTIKDSEIDLSVLSRLAIAKPETLVKKP